MKLLLDIHTKDLSLYIICVIYSIRIKTVVAMESLLTFCIFISHIGLKRRGILLLIAPVPVNCFAITFVQIA